MELFKDFQSSCEAGFFRPLSDYVRAKKEGRSVPPYLPSWRVMPLHKLCQLALAWNEAGFTAEAGELATVLSLLKKFPTLWCPENEFIEEKTLHLFTLLDEIDPIPSETLSELPVELFNGESISAAFTVSGKGSSLGVIRLGDVEIRSFGPQVLPLSRRGGFGIDGDGGSRWGRIHALPDCWVEIKPHCSENECKIETRTIGLKPETPLAFVFYVKAGWCRIGNEIFQPKTLRSFQGEVKEIIFEDTWVIESENFHKVQMIPLAGEGGFWNCDFLLSFEISPYSPHASFAAKSLSLF